MKSLSRTYYLTFNPQVRYIEATVNPTMIHLFVSVHLQILGQKINLAQRSATIVLYAGHHVVETVLTTTSH